MFAWRYHLPILTYHRVGRFRGDHVPTISGEAFERQLALLRRHRYRVVKLDDVAAALARGEAFPKRSAAITFDDGYEETHSVAWPILRRFDVPATVFVTPAEVGLSGFATWEQLRAMAQDGVAIGSHTMHHENLPLLQADQLEEELVGSKRVIEERIGRPVRIISYPVGGFTPEVQELVRRAGYLAACTTNRALPSRDIDRFALRRIKMTERDRHRLAFLVKISGYYDLFRELRRPS